MVNVPFYAAEFHATFKAVREQSKNSTKKQLTVPIVYHQCHPISPHDLGQQLSVYSLELMQGPDKCSPCHGFPGNNILLVVHRWVLLGGQYI